MCDVRFGVEFFLAVDTALDFFRPDRLDNRRNALEKVVLLFLGLEAGVEAGFDTLQPLDECGPGPPGNFIPHENSNSINLLPFAVEGEERSDFEVARGDVDGLRDLAPVVEIAEDLPVVVAVIDDEEL